MKHRGCGSMTAQAVLIAAALATANDVRAADLAAPKVLPPPAAATSVPIDFIFGARIQSDYNFRGISQSNRRPSPQAYGELQFLDNLFYVGTAAYRVDLPTKPQYEIDLTGGVRPKFGPLTFDFGYIFYYYPDERRLIDQTGLIYTPANTDFLELAGKVAWAIDDQWTVGSGVFHAWNWLGSGAAATYANLTAKYAIPQGALGIFPAGFAVSGELGYYSLGTTSPQLGSLKLADYTYWNAGVSYTYENLTLDLRYHDTDLSKQECFLNTTDPKGIVTGTGRSRWCDATFIATLSADFVASKLGVFAPPAR